MPRLSSHFGLQDPRLQSLVFPLCVPAVFNTTANTTLTPAQLLGGLILRDGNGGARTDTLPSAAALVEAIQGCMVGTCFEFAVRNTSSTAIGITLAVGAGGTASGTMATAQNNSSDYLLVFTNVGIGTEAYTLYSKGTGVF